MTTHVTTHMIAHRPSQDGDNGGGDDGDNGDSADSTESPWQADDAALLALEAEIPVLSALRAFAARAERANWFANLGDPIDSETETLVRAYLDALGFPDADAAPVLNWDDALDASASLDLNTEAWEAEEQLRAALMDAVLGGLSEEGLGIMLAHLAARLAEVVPEYVDEALMMADAPPDTMRELAVGAAQQAAHGAALALAAAALAAARIDDPEAGAEALNHPLLLRYRVFERGRWPLALTGRTLNLF